MHAMQLVSQYTSNLEREHRFLSFDPSSNDNLVLMPRLLSMLFGRVFGAFMRAHELKKFSGIM